MFIGVSEYCEFIDEDITDAKYCTSLCSEALMLFSVNESTGSVAGQCFMQFN